MLSPTRLCSTLRHKSRANEYIAQYSHLQNPKQRALLEAIDVARGRAMGARERNGELENTLLVFLNDNGGAGRIGWEQTLERHEGVFP